MNRQNIILTLCAVIVTACFTPVRADEVWSKTEAANRLYKQGKFEKALKLYEDALLLSPEESRLKMNRGLALLGTGDLEGAEKSMEGALSDKDKKSLATAHYNLGNLLYLKGEALLQQGQQGNKQAQESYKKALDNYIRSLDIDPSQIDAKWNLQLAHERIKQLEQQQQQQDKNDKNNKPPEPSAHAKKIKAKADKLVGKGQYSKALPLMTELLRTDSTAVSYGSYTKRLKDVTDSQ